MTYDIDETPTLVNVCNDCGSLVVNKTAHDKWHDSINIMAGRAAKGESAWGMFQPLGSQLHMLQDQ